MIPFEFDYARPTSFEEVVALLRDHSPDARLLASGTDLLPNMRVGYSKPPLLVSLGGIAPEPPRIEPDGTLRIDALSRLTDIIESDVVREAAPMIADSALAVGGNQVREAGTVGGNLCQENRCLYLNQKHDYQFAGRLLQAGRWPLLSVPRQRGRYLLVHCHVGHCTGADRAGRGARHRRREWAAIDHSRRAVHRSWPQSADADAG